MKVTCFIQFKIGKLYSNLVCYSIRMRMQTKNKYYFLRWKSLLPWIIGPLSANLWFTDGYNLFNCQLHIVCSCIYGGIEAAVNVSNALHSSTVTRRETVTCLIILIGVVLNIRYYPGEKCNKLYPVSMVTNTFSPLC